MSTHSYEQYVLDAENAFAQGLYQEGKAYLDNAIAEEPTYGKAHNHLGWYYMFHQVDYAQAEVHLKLALKYAKQYSAPYIHMITLLFEAKRLDEHEKLVAKAMYVPGVSKSFLYNEIGRYHEVTGKITKAIRYYRMAIRWSFDKEEIEIIRENISRAKSKRWLSLNI
jgi:tetratricopeptide (TPR) repeat protein